MSVWHCGRAFHGHAVEDQCPCPKAECGLVSEALPECLQHGLQHARTMRQGHPADQCPGAGEQQ